MKLKHSISQNKISVQDSSFSALRCIRQSRNLLWYHFPSLSEGLSALHPEKSHLCRSLGTDGRILYYNEKWILKTWNSDSRQVVRCLLHILLHCFYFHIWDVDAGDSTAQAAADTQIEQILRQEIQRNRLLSSVLGEADFMGAQDDHSFWPVFSAKNFSGDTQKHWKQCVKHMGSIGTESSGGSDFGLIPKGDQITLDQIQKSKNDYRSFLLPFLIWKEMQEMDPESIDYIYYSLGMEQYDKMPLIEPLEYREGHKLEQLVIAIDTSGSVKDETVRRFLEETYAILDEKENVFDQMEVWILQCDLVIEDAKKITCRKDWDIYCSHVQITGRAGTDFRPVFRWVSDMQEKGELLHLKGLIYFTDGDGIYPGEAPPYKTAFLHVDEGNGFSNAPAWVTALQVKHLI